MSYDLSIFLPTIRPQLISAFYDSILKSCTRYSFEVIFSGPFPPPDEIRAKENVKWIKSFAHPTKAAQMAALIAESNLLFHCTDDLIFLENSIDDAIDQYKNECGPGDVISMRYTESANFENSEPYPLTYWTLANWIPPMEGLDLNWNINAHFLMSKDLFLGYGGFDCNFIYLTHACGDLLTRIQLNSGKVINSKNNISLADWSGATKGKEHLAIQDSQENFDTALFRKLWSTPNSRPNPFLLAYSDFPMVWKRRFPDGTKLPENYEQMMEQQ